MKRSGKIIVMCHCLLNANSIVHGLSSYPGINIKAVMPYLEKGTGVVQLPCPETTYLGMRRWGMTQEQYDHPGYRRHCREILTSALDEIESFQDAGYEMLWGTGGKGKSKLRC